MSENIYKIVKVVKEKDIKKELESMEQDLVLSREQLKDRIQQLVSSKNNKDVDVRQKIIESIQAECSYISHLVSSIGEVYELEGENIND